MDEIAEAILKEVRRVGYVVSTHAMGEYVEMHAVNPSMPDDLKIARCAVADPPDDDAAHRQCALTLADMVNAITPDPELQFTLDGNPTPRQIGDNQLVYMRDQLINHRLEDFGDKFHAEIEGEDVTQKIRECIEWPDGVEGVGDRMQRLHGEARVEMFELGEGMMKFNEVLKDARMYIAEMLHENVAKRMERKGFSRDDLARVFSPNHIRRWMINIDDD